MTTLLFKKLHRNATIPSQGSDHAAGYDLSYSGEEPIPTLPGQRLLVPTGLAWAAPNNVYGRIAPRSGMAWNYGFDVLAGVVDPDYRGEIKVLLINLDGHTNEKGEPTIRVIEPGQKVAQLIITPFLTPEIVRCKHLPDSVRDEGGFGSTGK